MNWVLGSHPVRAVAGLGGRQVRTGPEYGNVYDHFAVDWDTAMKSTTRLGPEKYELGPYPTPPVAMPGKYRFL